MGQPTAGTNGAVGALTTSGIAAYPATTSVGQILWMFITSDSATIPSTFSGWTEYGTLNTSGSMSSRKFYRYADGTEGGTSVTVSGVTGGTMGFCWIASVNRSAAGFTVAPVDVQIGTDTTSNNTAYAATAGASSTTLASDLLVSFTVHKAVGTPLTGNPTGGTITQTGATLGTNAGMFGSRNVANTGYTSFFSRPITAGATAAIGQTFTTVGSNVTGHSVFIVLRETASNVAPTANAGPDQTVDAFATVTLTGAASSDSDGTVASYAWAQVSGPAVTLSSATAVSPTFTAPANTAGTSVVFGLTVTDNAGAASTQDAVTVTVRPHVEWLMTAGGLVAVRRG